MTPYACPNGHAWTAENPGSVTCPVCGEPPDRNVTLPSQGPGAADATATRTPNPTVAVPGGAGFRLPGYEILGEIGRGAMGVVYRARDERLNRPTALKMILAGVHAGDSDHARFRREAEAVAALDHPNIVRVYAVGDVGGLPYCALEYVPGGTLANRIAGKPLPPREAAEIAATVAGAGAVQCAHDAGIVHRDLKPSNVLLAADGAPKVADFGLAKRVGSGTGPTATGAVLGTPAYMAPEQAGGDAKRVGPPADVYALGAILYECLTGRPPFAGDTPLDTIMKVVGEEPVPPSRLAAVPRDLESVCLGCLEKEPARRYSSAAALADDLRRFLDGEPVRVRPPGRLRAWRRAARRHRRALVVGVVAAAIVGAVALTQRPAPEPPAPPPPAAAGVPELLVRAACADGDRTGEAWFTPEPGVVATILAVLGGSAGSARAAKVEVVWRGGRTFPAEVAGVDAAVRVVTLRLVGDNPPLPPAARPLPPEGVERAKRSVALVRVARGGGPSSDVGWLAERRGKDGYLVTTAHALGMKEPGQPPPDRVEAVFGPGTPRERVLACRIVAVDRDDDFAILQVEGDDLPPLLPVAPLAGLGEGAPLTALSVLPRAATGSEAVTAALVRHAGWVPDKDGYTKYVQFEVVYDQGVADGPLLDGEGNVRAATVAAFPDRKMRFVFAMPSEYVARALDGQVVAIVPGPAVQADGAVEIPLTVEFADPLRRIGRLGLEVWTAPRPDRKAGQASVRPARPPVSLPGESPRVDVPLAYDPAEPLVTGESPTAAGTARLPPLGDGQVYWLQPRYTGQGGKSRWGEAFVIEMGRHPIDRRTVELFVKNVKSSERRIDLRQRQFVVSAVGGTPLGTEFDFTLGIAE